LVSKISESIICISSLGCKVNSNKHTQSNHSFRETKGNRNEGYDIKRIKYLMKYPYHLTACYHVTYHPNNPGCMKYTLCSVGCRIRKHYCSCSTLWKSSKIHISLRV